MAGRTPSAARKAFLQPIHRVLACVTKDQIVRPTPRGPGDDEALTLSEDPVLLRTRSHERVGFSVAQRFVVVETDDRARGPYKVSTRGYWYRVENEAGKELVAWHWHPLGPSAYGDPHLHVGSRQLADLHLPTERVSIESVVRFLITELDVRPLAKNWQEILDQAEEAFREWRTWPGRRG